MARACAGCDAEIAGDPRRKWCSERCRKASYGDPCIDCGARTAFGAETARVPEPRCLSCARRLSLAEKYRDQRERLAEMHQAGATYKEIADAFGWPNPNYVGKYVWELRQMGYELPYRYAGVTERHAA